MSGKRRRTTVTLVLANYVLALTVGSGLHVHGDRARHGEAAGCAPASAHSAGCSHAGHHLHDASGGAEPSEATAAAGAAWDGANACPVCAFLAQKPVPGHRVEQIACTGTVAPVVLRAVVYVAAPEGSPISIRGPPSVA